MRLFLGPKMRTSGGLSVVSFRAFLSQPTSLRNSKYVEADLYVGCWQRQRSSSSNILKGFPYPFKKERRPLLLWWSYSSLDCLGILFQKNCLEAAAVEEGRVE